MGPWQRKSGRDGAQMGNRGRLRFSRQCREIHAIGFGRRCRPNLRTRFARHCRASFVLRFRRRCWRNSRCAWKTQRFRRRCRRNWPPEVEGPTSEEIALGVTSPKPLHQITCQPFEECLAVICSFLSALLILHDPASHLPIGSRHNGIDGARGGTAGRVEQLHNVGEDRVIAWHCHRAHGLAGRKRLLLSHMAHG